MNERIKQLAAQANILIVPEPFDVASRAWNANMEEFAELIVRECVTVGVTAFLNDNGKVPVFPAKQIRDHFGVEE